MPGWKALEPRIQYSWTSKDLDWEIGIQLLGTTDDYIEVIAGVDPSQASLELTHDQAVFCFGGQCQACRESYSGTAHLEDSGVGIYISRSPCVQQSMLTVDGAESLPESSRRSFLRHAPVVEIRTSTRGSGPWRMSTGACAKSSSPGPQPRPTQRQESRAMPGMRWRCSRASCDDDEEEGPTLSLGVLGCTVTSP